jgi:hypothetical protein
LLFHLLVRLLAVADVAVHDMQMCFYSLLIRLSTSASPFSVVLLEHFLHLYYCIVCQADQTPLFSEVPKEQAVFLMHDSA